MSTELFKLPLAKLERLLKPGECVTWHIRLGDEEQKQLFALAKHHYQGKEITMQDVGELLADLTRAVVTLSHNKMHEGFPVEPEGGFSE